jgi:hypothetical protein
LSHDQRATAFLASPHPRKIQILDVYAKPLLGWSKRAFRLFKTAYSNFGEEIKVSRFVGQRCAKRGLSPDAMKLQRFWIVPPLDESKGSFSNLFPRGVKSEIVDFSKIGVSLDLLLTFLSREK